VAYIHGALEAHRFTLLAQSLWIIESPNPSTNDDKKWFLRGLIWKSLMIILKHTLSLISKIYHIKTRDFAITSKWFLYFILIGLIAGLGAVIFHYLCQICLHFFMDSLAGYHPPSPAGEEHLFPPTQTPFNRWILLFLPAFGGIFSGWLVYTFAPEAEGHGTDAAIDAYHNKNGFIRNRIPFIKTIASTITITTGGSGGREGPIAQIGAGFGSFLATRLNLSEQDRRIMMAAGVGAGVGSIFRAPMAGALFAAEVLYRDPEFEPEVLLPAGISSIVAYCIFCLFFGWGTLFESQDFIFCNPLELGPYFILSLFLAAAGWLYVKTFYGVIDISKDINIPNHLKPALGGLLTGVVGFFLPQTLSFGYGFAQMALDNQLPTLLLFSIAIGKILTTSFSIGSGGSGGVFGPSIVIGGALGGAIGNIFHAIMPGIVTQPGAFVVVGMAGFFAGVANTPISTIIFVSEMTNSYHLLLPCLLVSSLTYLFSMKWTIFRKQVKSRIDSNAHRGDFFVDVLATIKVEELMPKIRKVNLIPEDMTLKEFRKIFCSSQQHYFPVINSEKELIGIFSINDIRSILFDQEVVDLVLMKDVANIDIISTNPSEDLNEVLKKCTVLNLHRIPVVQEDNQKMLLGMLDRKEIIQFYNSRVQEIKASNQGKILQESLEITKLKRLKVKQAMSKEVEIVSAEMKLNDLKEFIYQRHFNSFPLVNAQGELCGILSLSDYQRAFKGGDMSLTAYDIGTHELKTVFGEDSFFSALYLIKTFNFAILPVVDKQDPKKLIGVISRMDIISSLSRIMLN